MQWTPAAIVLVSTSALSLGIASILFRRRAIPGASLLALAMLAVAEWSLVAGLEASSVALSTKILFSKLEYIGSGSAAVLFLAFAARYTGHAARLTGVRFAALWLLPLAGITLTATNELHGLIWTGFIPGPAGTNTVLYRHGTAFFLIVAWIYVYVFTASVLLIRSAVQASTIQRRQSATILVAAAFPLAAGILYVCGITFVPGLNLTPISLVVTGAVFAIGILPLRLFKLVPVARERLIEGMSDGVLVVDPDLRVVDVNPAARELLNLPRRVIGTDVRQVFQEWPEVAKHLLRQGDSHLEVTLTRDPLRHADLRVASLRRGRQASSGVLIVLRDITPRYLAETSLQQAHERLKAQVLEIERLRDELREQAIRDALTGLFNRRHLDDMMPRILERAARDRRPVAVVMIDIDHFKRINDTHGHRAGDALLRQLGELLIHRTRPADIACRYGGEEFVLVLPETTLSVAAERAEALRCESGNLLVADLASEPTPTLSAGIAAYPDHGTTQDELLRAADEALYRAKSSGRNCVRLAAKGRSHEDSADTLRQP